MTIIPTQLLRPAQFECARDIFTIAKTLLAIFFILYAFTHSHAQLRGSVSNLPLPRFVSLKAERVNMRVGPGRDYQVQWLYTRKGLPMEIIQEFDNWRKVRDPKGVEGWILHSLLSGKRTIIVAPWNTPDKKEKKGTLRPTVNMYVTMLESSNIVALVEAGVLVSVKECANGWCQLSADSHRGKRISGYVKQSLLWGVYPDEEMNN